MLTAIFSFMGSAIFRVLWGEISAWITKKQEHATEMDLMRLQGQLADAAHKRSMESIKLQKDLQVEVIRVQAEATVSEIETQGWLEAVKATSKRTGIRWVDAWNQTIRPAVATWSILMITGHYMKVWTLDDYGWSLCGAALGIYLADRGLFKRGK